MLLARKLRAATAAGAAADPSWNLANAVYLQSFSVATQETSPTDVFFKPDGLKMYVIGSGGDNIYEYDLSTAWDVSTASYLQTLNIGVYETGPRGIVFKPDGLQVYFIGSAGDDINEWALTTAWDISTASALRSFSVKTQDDAPMGLFLKPDGLKLYVVGQRNDKVYEYDLSTAWDISSASYLQTFDPSVSEGNPAGIFLKPDGLKMYISGRQYDNIYEFDLSTAWDISTTSYLQSFSVATQETSPHDVFFKPDGLKMYVIGDGYGGVHEYDFV